MTLFYTKINKIVVYCINMKVLGLKMKTKNIVILLLAVVGAVYVVRKLMKTTEFFNAPYPQSHTNSSIIQEQKIEQQGGTPVSTTRPV